MLGLVGLSLLVLLATAGASAGGLHRWYPVLARPPLALPGPGFGPVWAVVHPLTGLAAWLVWRRIDVGLERKRAGLRLWGWLLLLGTAWPAAFFGLHSPALGAVALLPPLLAAGWTLRAFRGLQRAGALLMLPYAAWLCYAAYLDAGFWWLNGG